MDEQLPITGSHPSARAYAEALGVRAAVERETDARFPVSKGPIRWAKKDAPPSDVRPSR